MILPDLATEASERTGTKIHCTSQKNEKRKYKTIQLVDKKALLTVELSF